MARRAKYRLAGLCDNPMPKLTISPSKGLWILLQGEQKLQGLTLVEIKFLQAPF